MTEIRAMADGMLAVFWRDLRTFTSYRTRAGTQLLSVFFSLTLFYYISRLVRIDLFSSPDGYYAFAVIGLIILQVVNSSLQSPPTALRQELVAGTYERIVLSPLGPIAGSVAFLIFPLLNALVTGTVMLAFAALVFGVHVEPTVPLALPVAVLGALAFAPFGLILLSVVLVVKQAVAGATWVVAAISLVAGLYFPVALLPDWIEWTSEVQPFTPTVDLLRHLTVGTELTDPAWLALVKLSAFAAMLLPPSLMVLSAAVKASRRRGTIIEY